MMIMIMDATIRLVDTMIVDATLQRIALLVQRLK